MSEYRQDEHTTAKEASKTHTDQSYRHNSWAFSPHPVSGEERRETAACIRTMQKELKAATGWYEKWIMKYIERLY